MMFLSNLTRRHLRIGACGAAIWLFAVPGMSEADKGADKAGKVDRKAACGGAFKSAKDAQAANHLREAQSILQSCVKAACSAFIKQECLTHYNQLDNDIPTVVPVVTDESGTALVDVTVTMDGEPLTSKLDGRALPVDPGTHEFTFNTPSGPITEKVMIAQGQRNRTIAIALHGGGKHTSKSTLAAQVTPQMPGEAKTETHALPDKPAEKAPPHHLLTSRSPVAEEETDAEVAAPPIHRGSPGAVPYILGGVGVASLGAAALLNVWGNKDNDAFSQCTPDCAHSSVKHVKTLYTLSDISIGAGIAALGVATYLFATGGSPTKEKPPTKTAYTLDVAPTSHGAFATVSGSF